LINGLNRAVGRADVQTGAVEADSALSYGDPKFGSKLRFRAGCVGAGLDISMG
jgi:hypothetical protein